MANAFKANVWVVDTDGAFDLTGPVHVVGVKLVAGAGATGTLSLKCDGASGTVVYQATCAQGTMTFDQVELKGIKDLAADIGGASAVAYVYLK